MSEFLNTLAQASLDIILRILGVIVVLVVGLRLGKYLSKKFKEAKANEKMDDTIRNLFGNLIRWSISVLVVVTICGLLNIPTASIIAAISAIGLAIGLALQGGLSNIAGGMMPSAVTTLSISPNSSMPWISGMHCRAPLSIPSIPRIMRRSAR